ncbi:putative zinc-finger of transcription factor IIIC complex-domain-containing protein [Rhodocollybia butyracea]|uniref:Zinc-finger of transcription factor IIIC complex-domain-containing protein n=1 Tax=Rhodocollybia butyracea TaxID=206335 RepID=A0A9P5PR58_9AGAR|nr:putative zinc-finger of transcription factor IIIC complex-domain-containing protein [Rhodocollybia butyracea]
MTPEHGINFDTNSALKSSVDEDREDRPSLGWFRTLITFDKTDATRWTDYSQDWGATSLGSMDITVWSMTLSPSHITRDAGCVLAVLSSNMDLTLWAAGKNGLKGEWKKISNVTSFLLEIFLKDESISRTASTIAAQILCISWSSKADFLLSPAPELDLSLLVCGNRTGDLLFMRYDEQTEHKIRIECRLRVSDTWILQVAVSPWILVQPMTCIVFTGIALVAYSTPDGTIGLVRIKQTLQPISKSSPFQFALVNSTVFEHLETTVSDTRKGALTSLKWIALPGHPSVLVYNRPGTIHFWNYPSVFPTFSSTNPSTPPSWSGLRSVQLKTQKQSVGSSFLQPVSGLQYLRHRDALLVCLVDGSFHVVYGIAGSGPVLDVSPIQGNETVLDSGSLSTTVRGVFMRVEREGVTFADVMRTSGMVCYDNYLGSVMWIHEASRPADFSYKHDAKHNSIFTVAQLWDDASDERILDTLKNVLSTSKVEPIPLYILRPVLFHFRRRPVLMRLHKQLIEILRLENGELEDDHTTNIHFDALDQPQPPAVDFDTRKHLRNSLKRHLFGYNKLLGLRRRLSLADYAWKLSSDFQKQADYGAVAQGLLMAISHRNLRTFIRHLSAVVQAFNHEEIPFILRLVVQSTLPGSPENLSAEGRQLSEIVNQIVSISQPEHNSHLNEKCPACGVDVPLQDIIGATCSNGHMWSRCSVTTFILSTAQVRTCIGCTRKAFLPFSSLAEGDGKDFLPPAVRDSWFVEELLEAVHRCLFCGNAFVRYV